MSLSNALSNAMSGIAAATRGTEVVSSNLANALTPGYARRELQLSARSQAVQGGGVHVDGVTRMVRTSVLAQGRLASAETARTQTLATFHKTMADSIGVPGEAGALTTLLADFDAELEDEVVIPPSWNVAPTADVPILLNGWWRGSRSANCTLRAGAWCRPGPRTRASGPK